MDALLSNMAQLTMRPFGYCAGAWKSKGIAKNDNAVK
jgi:hypothetical protein